MATCNGQPIKWWEAVGRPPPTFDRYGKDVMKQARKLLGFMTGSLTDWRYHTIKHYGNFKQWDKTSKQEKEKWFRQFRADRWDKLYKC